MVFVVKCLRKVLGVGRIGTVKNRGIRERRGNNAHLLERVDWSTLRWFGHMEREQMKEE